MLWFDPAQMQKVFYNLISNAFKYTPKDGTITIVVHQSGETVKIDIIVITTNNSINVNPLFCFTIKCNMYY